MNNHVHCKKCGLTYVDLVYLDENGLCRFCISDNDNCKGIASLRKREKFKNLPNRRVKKRPSMLFLAINSPYEKI